MIFPVNHVPFIKRAITLSIVLVVIFLGACKKGDTGPPGSANVTYSAWFTPSPWTQSTIFGVKNFDCTQPAPGITQSVLDSSIVLVYGKLSGYNTAVWPAGQVALLPITLTYQQGSIQSDTWSAYDTVGKIRINFVNNVNYYSSIATTHSFRYIIVPGAVKAGRQMDLRSMSYAEVCNYLKISQ